MVQLLFHVPNDAVETFRNSSKQIKTIITYGCITEWPTGACSEKIFLFHAFRQKRQLNFQIVCYASSWLASSRCSDRLKSWWLLYSCFSKFRSSHRRCSVRKSVFRNFEKFTGKHLCQSLFFIKLQSWGLQLY